MATDDRTSDTTKGIISATQLPVIDLSDAPDPPDSTAPRPLLPLSSTPAKTPPEGESALKPNQVRTVMLNGVPIVALVIDGKERLCLAQISNTLLKNFSYNEIHNRRVALGITCVQCTPVQLEILRRAGAMPISSRRCGMITKREAERLCKSFLTENSPPKLPENFSFDVFHQCSWGSRGHFVPSRYNSSRAKCIKCFYCNMFFSPNKFIFHSHRLPDSKYTQPDAANFNSWRRHLKLSGDPDDETVHAWEDVKAMFNGGSRRRVMIASAGGSRFQLVKRSRLEDSNTSSEAVGRNIDSTVTVTTGGPGASTGVVSDNGKSPPSFIPMVPFTNKGFGMLQPHQHHHHHHHHHPLHGPPYLSRTTSGTTFSPLEDKALSSGGPDFRQGFAEYMWSTKQVPFPPSPYGLVWPPRGSNSSGMASPSSETSPVPQYYDNKSSVNVVKDLLPPVSACSSSNSKGLEDLSDSSRGCNGESDRASDLGTPTQRPLSSCSDHEQRMSDADIDLERSSGVHEGTVFTGFLRRSISHELPLHMKNNCGSGGYLSAFRPVIRNSNVTGGKSKITQDSRILGRRNGNGNSPFHPEPAFPDEGRVTSTRTDRDSVVSTTPMISSSDGENVDIEITDDEPASGTLKVSELTLGVPPPVGANTPPALLPMIDSRPKPLLFTHDEGPGPNQMTDAGLSLSSPGVLGNTLLSPLPNSTSPHPSCEAMKGKQVECDPQRLASLSKEELEEILVEEANARRRAEKEFQLMKESFQEQVKREVAYREEIAKQLQLVRGRDVSRGLCLSSPIEAMPRIGSREEIEIRCVAEAQRSPRRSAPFIVQDLDFATLYRMRLQATNPAALNPLVPASFHRKPCEGCLGSKPRQTLLPQANGNTEHFRLHSFAGASEIFGSNWTL